MTCRRTIRTGATAWRDERGEIALWLMAFAGVALTLMLFSGLKKLEHAYRRSFYLFLPRFSVRALVEPEATPALGERYLQLPPRFDYGVAGGKALAVCLFMRGGEPPC